jgi:hypothetical protein
MSAPNPNCVVCGGVGAAPEKYNPPHPPTFRRCECVLRSDLVANAERGLVGLSSAPVISSTPLLGKETQNVWVTAGQEFLAHLRHIAIRKPITWCFRVNSDAEMVTAWLATLAISGQEIFDADAHTVSTRYMTLPDMVVPPDLLVVRLGVKVARNAAANEVLMEAIQLRMHESKPTWLWDEPHNPLGPGHLFWSDALGRTLSRWERLQRLDVPAKAQPQRSTLPREVKEPRRLTIRRSPLPAELLAPDITEAPKPPELEAAPEPEAQNSKASMPKAGRKSLRSIQ